VNQSVDIYSDNRDENRDDGNESEKSLENITVQFRLNPKDSLNEDEDDMMRQS
jgi:hypothetical protein